MTDIGDLIDPLKREVSPPGSDLFPDATDDDWFGQLQDSFWQAGLEGVIDLDTYDEDGNGTISPDISGDIQQIIVIYAGIRIVRSELRNLNTNFKAVAGPVEFQQEKSAMLLKDILEDMQKRKSLLLDLLSEYATTDSHYLDMVSERHDSVGYADTYFWTN